MITDKTLTRLETTERYMTDAAVSLGYAVLACPADRFQSLRAQSDALYTALDKLRAEVAEQRIALGKATAEDWSRVDTGY